MTAGTHAPAAPDRAGFVSLVGAGPGDPELLTLKAARRLAEADLLLYDGLVPTAITTLATRAQHFCVSKRAGRPAVDQETIHQVMIRGARRGKRVVRLKNGDPFLLGRGGEEALALRAAGIPFEVVPGVHGRDRGAPLWRASRSRTGESLPVSPSCRDTRRRPSSRFWTRSSRGR